MNITQALEIIRNAPKDAKTFQVKLACGFTPLHLQTFLTAHLQRALADRQVQVTPGLYGSLLNTVQECLESGLSNVVIPLEWADLDPRLGYRAFHVWNAATELDIVANAKRSLDMLLGMIRTLRTRSEVLLSMPTLAVAPVFHTNSWHLSEAEAELRASLSAFEASAVAAGISVVNHIKLASVSPLPGRYDFKSDLLMGIPYSLAHANALAEAFAHLMLPPTPKKGIITDLDDTLWAGLVGEVGVEGVHWDLQGHAAVHGWYQMLLASLSEAGVLLAVASKNDREVVEKAFRRSDILLLQERIFPMEVHWQAKSGSVSRILQAWNISADAVVFVDDNPAELAEVAAAHSGIECVQFPPKDYAAGFNMLQRLRDLCGKRYITQEDSVRLESIRRSAEAQSGEREETSEDFLRQADAVVTFEDTLAEIGSRPLELVNKTNQFNLNGVRYTESEWRALTSAPGSCLLVADYKDRFGILGKVAVTLGHLDGETLRIRVWVMSCRAFGRRIEYLCLHNLFARYPIRQMEFDVVATEKNGPFRTLMQFLVGDGPNGPNVLTRERFYEVCPPLYQTVEGSLTRHGANEGPLSKVL